MNAVTLTTHRDTLNLLKTWVDKNAFSDIQLQRVLDICQWDADFARTALTMQERPAWVLAIIHKD